MCLDHEEETHQIAINRWKFKEVIDHRRDQTDMNIVSRRQMLTAKSRLNMRGEHSLSRSLRGQDVNDQRVIRKAASAYEALLMENVLEAAARRGTSRPMVVIKLDGTRYVSKQVTHGSK